MYKLRLISTIQDGVSITGYLSLVVDETDGPALNMKQFGHLLTRMLRAHVAANKTTN